MNPLLGKKKRSINCWGSSITAPWEKVEANPTRPWSYRTWRRTEFLVPLISRAEFYKVWPGLRNAAEVNSTLPVPEACRNGYEVKYDQMLNQFTEANSTSMGANGNYNKDRFLLNAEWGGGGRMKENLQFFSLPAGDYIIHYYFGMKIVKDSLIRPKRESLQRDPQVGGKWRFGVCLWGALTFKLFGHQQH